MLPRSTAASSTGRDPAFIRPARFARSAGPALALIALSLLYTLTFGLPGRATDQVSELAGLRALSQETAAPLVVYSEYGEEIDSLWAADPDDPSRRTQIARVQHARGFGISPSLSPDGRYVAYNMLAPGGTLSSQAADLWLLETKTGSGKRLATGVDLPGAPVWSPAGDAVVVRASAAGEGGGAVRLLRVGIDGTAAELVAQDIALYPVAFAPDGASFYYATLSAAGSDLMRVPTAGGAPETIARLSDSLARDWQLSPDGTRLAFLAQEGGAFTARVLDLATKDILAVEGAGGAQFNPVFETNGDLTVGRLPAGGPAGALRLEEGGETLEASAARLPAPARGFDVPLDWSPDGARLAVREFAGVSATDPGPSSVVVIGPDGARRALSSRSDVVIAGWLEDGP